MTEPIALEARGIDKRFGGTRALVDAGLLLRPGTVHALLGGNGSGKSTMIKCLAGVHRADAGVVRIHDRTLDAAELDPETVHAAGLRVVHQDLGLFDRISIAENFAFESGFPTRGGGSIAWSGLRRRVAELLDQYGVAARPEALVGTLRPAQKTLVAIARALQDQQGSEFVLLLDEPTASLPQRESEALLASLRERAATGQTIAFVSHRLDEVRSVADEITVFRDGRVAGVLPGTASEEQVVGLIAGSPGTVADETPSRSHLVGAVTERRASTESPVLSVTDLVVGPLRGVDLTVASGEVVGVAGLLGSGRSTLLDVVFGARPVERGQVAIEGRPLRRRSVSAAMRRGVAHVPENRLRDAAFTAMTVRENASAAVLSTFWTGWMRAGREKAATQSLIERFNIRTAGAEAPILSLSGGNQQKVVLARWLRREPRLLLLDEPTQGVDVVARGEIYAALREASAAGCGVLIASSDHEDLAAVCDRVVVLADGRADAEISGDGLTADRITHLVQSDQHVAEALA